MRYGSAFLLLVSLCASAAAQRNSRPTVPSSGPFAYRGCPVGFLAQRQSATELRYAADGKPVRNGQGVRLALVSSSEKKIVKASAIVHGVSNKSRLLPVSDEAQADLAEIFVLGLGFELRLRSDVWPDKVGIVQWVDQTEIQYADGSAWQATPSTRCRVAPSNGWGGWSPSAIHLHHELFEREDAAMSGLAGKPALIAGGTTGGRDSAGWGDGASGRRFLRLRGTDSGRSASL